MTAVVAQTKTISVLHTAASRILESNRMRKALRIQNNGPTNYVRIKNDSIPGASNVTEIQRLTVSEAPGAGSFKIKYGSQTTAAIPYTANAAAVQTALRLLTGLGSVTVAAYLTIGFAVTMTGVALPTLPFEIVENTLTAGTDEVQTATFSATPEAGSFRFVYTLLGSNNTRYVSASKLIPYTANASLIQGILRQLLGDSGLTVTGGYGSAFVITFKNRIDHEMLAIADNTLSLFTEEVQTLTFDVVPTAGAYKLSYGSETTGSLAYDADAAAIQVALRLLTGLSAVTVTGDYSAGFVITFVGVPLDVELLAVVDNTLTIPVVWEEQIIELSTQPATTGDVSFVYGAQTTDPIAAADLNAANIQTALRALDGLEAVVVTGSQAADFTVQFVDVLADAELLDVADNTLDDGDELPITFTITEDVAYEAEIEIVTDVEETTKGVTSTAITGAVVETTKGVANHAVTIVQSIGTAGSSATDGYELAAGAVLDLPEELTSIGEYYAKADTATIELEIIESIG